MEERRSAKRVSICLDARWETSGVQGNRVTDLSESGCYIDGLSEPIFGRVFPLTLKLPGGNTFEVNVVVAHHTPGLGFGAHFVDLTPEQRQLIRSLIGKDASCAVAANHDHTSRRPR